MGFLSPHFDKIYAATRILAGLMFMFHGLHKVFGLFGGPPDAPAYIVWGAGLIELIGGTLIAVGLFAAPAAFIASGMMAVAFFIGHVAQHGSIVPIVNDGEMAVLYCWIFLVIAARGAGIWSADAARGDGGEASA